MNVEELAEALTATSSVSWSVGNVLAAEAIAKFVKGQIEDLKAEMAKPIFVDQSFPFALDCAKEEGQVIRRAVWSDSSYALRVSGGKWDKWIGGRWTDGHQITGPDMLAEDWEVWDAEVWERKEAAG